MKTFAQIRQEQADARLKQEVALYASVICILLAFLLFTFREEVEMFLRSFTIIEPVGFAMCLGMFGFPRFQEERKPSVIKSIAALPPITPAVQRQVPRHVSRPYYNEQENAWHVVSDCTNHYGCTSEEALGSALASFIVNNETLIVWHDPILPEPPPPTARKDGLDHIFGPAITQNNP